MDHKTFIQELPPEELAALSRTEDRAGVLHLIGHGALILGLGVWIAFGWPLWQLVLLPQGIAICFLFTLVHETTHRTPFQNLTLNEWVGRAAGFAILLPLLWFRYFHLAHHRYTNLPGKDPELLAGAKPETLRAYIWHICGLPYWLGMARQVIGNALGRDPGDYVPKPATPRIAREARWMLVLYGLVALSFAISQLLFWVWLLPALLGQPFLRLYLLAEHGRCAPVANMFENTRTTYTGVVIRFLAWNMPYHVEHHTLPMVPFHRLPDLNTRMAAHLKVTAPGYGAFTKDYLTTLPKR